MDSQKDIPKFAVIGIRRIDKRSTCFSCMDKSDIERLEDIVFSDSMDRSFTCHKCKKVFTRESESAPNR